MAGLFFWANITVALSGTAAKTWMFIEAPNNQKVKLHQLRGYLLGTVPADSPCIYDLLWGTKGSGTAASTITCIKANPLDTETIQTAVKQSYGGGNEPTYTGGTNGLITSFGRHPQSALDFVNPLVDSPLTIPGGGALGIRATTAASYNLRLSALLEE